MGDGIVLIVSIFGGKQGVRRCIYLPGIVHHRVVKTGPSHHAQPVGDLPLESTVEGISVGCVLKEIAVGLPVRVLRSVKEVQIPELGHDALGRIPSLIYLILGDVRAAREKINRDKRVVVLPLYGRIALVLLHVACAQIEGKLVLDQFGGIAHRHIVSVVYIVRDDSP